MSLKHHANICNVVDAVQIQPTAAAKPPGTAKLVIKEQLSYLILKLFFVQLIPYPAACTPDLPSHGTNS